MKKPDGTAVTAEDYRTPWQVGEVLERLSADPEGMLGLFKDCGLVAFDITVEPPEAVAGAETQAELTPILEKLYSPLWQLHVTIVSNPLKPVPAGG